MVKKNMLCFTLPIRLPFQCCFPPVLLFNRASPGLRPGLLLSSHFSVSVSRFLEDSGYASMCKLGLTSGMVCGAHPTRLHWVYHAIEYRLHAKQLTLFRLEIRRANNTLIHKALEFYNLVGGRHA